MAQPHALLIESTNSANTFSNRLEATLTRAGYVVERRNFDVALDPQSFSSSHWQLVAIPDARTLPHALHTPLDQFLRRGGDLLAFGLPAWSKALLRDNGHWMEAEEYATRNVTIPSAHPLTILTDVPLTQWARSSNEPASKATYEIVPQTLSDVTIALHAVVANLTGWDTLTTPPLTTPFAAGTDRTVFSAKGGPSTHALAMEWEEQDGSRWIATVPLTTQWRRYELAPTAFRYWQSNPQRSGDHFRPEQAARFKVGLAFSHSGSEGGRQEWWIGNVGTASSAESPLASLGEAASLDGLYPGYKDFRIHEAHVNLRAVAPVLFPVSHLPVPEGTVYSPQPRPSGAGFDKERNMRFVPLLEARAVGSNLWRGVPGALYVHDTKGRYHGGRWAIFGITDPVFLASPGLLSAVETLARRLRGPLLYEGGTDWYTAFPNQPLHIGARLAAWRESVSPKANLRVQIQVAQSQSGRSIWQKTWPASGQPVAATWLPPRGERGPWRVDVTLWQGQQVLDALSHEVYVWNYPSKPQFVTAAQGRFLLGGKPWKIHGVNYMPSSGIARDLPEDANDFELWLGKAPYDPVIVGRDLDNIKRLGLNAVSIFIYGGSRNSGNLLDILRQCAARGLKVNLGLRPGTPIDFAPQWKEIRPVMEMYHLRDCDTIFAYDLAWEPGWGSHDARQMHDAVWTQWVLRRYGSIEQASIAWGFPAPRSGNGLTNPPDEQVSHNGPWRKLAIDYRKFLVELLRQRYGQARQMVRSVDPHHLVSFRMSEAGDPTNRGDASLPYDFPGLAEVVDFLAPEAYGRIGIWEKTRPGWFEVAYARAVAPTKPVIWAEVGTSSWVPGLDEAPPNRLQFQADFFRAFYRMMLASGANGLFHWWYPGGFRNGENSDFGIINPDGTDRPASRVIREQATAFLHSPAPVPTNAKLGIQLWQHADGIFGIYESVGPQFWQLVAQGKQPQLVIQNK